MVVCLKELSNWSPDIKKKELLTKLDLKITLFELNVNFALNQFESPTTTIPPSQSKHSLPHQSVKTLQPRPKHSARVWDDCCSVQNYKMMSVSLDGFFQTITPCR
jgi:hypothetical protein